MGGTALQGRLHAAQGFRPPKMHVSANVTSRAVQRVASRKQLQSKKEPGNKSDEPVIHCQRVAGATSLIFLCLKQMQQENEVKSNWASPKPRCCI